MINKYYEKMLLEMREVFLNNTKYVPKINISNLSNEEKNKIITELEKEVNDLKMELIIREEVSKQYINGLIESKYASIVELLENPLIKLPSGVQIEFNDLNDEQLKYLESLNPKKIK